MRGLGWIVTIILLVLSVLTAAMGYGLFFGIGLYLVVCVPLIWYLTTFEKSIHRSTASRELLRTFLIYLPCIVITGFWVSDGLKQSERKQARFEKVAALNPDEKIEMSLFHSKGVQSLILKIPRCFLTSRQQYGHDFELLYFDKTAFSKGEFVCPPFGRAFSETDNYLDQKGSVMASLVALPAFNHNSHNDFLRAFSETGVNGLWRQAVYENEKNGWHRYTVRGKVGLLKMSQGNFVFIQYEPDSPAASFMSVDTSLQKPEFMLGVSMEDKQHQREVKDFVSAVLRKQEIRDTPEILENLVAMDISAKQYIEKISEYHTQGISP